MYLSDSQYQIGGVNALSIVEEFGAPTYVYDGNKIIENYHKIKDAFAACNVKIKYACKALTNINILRLLKNEGCGIDAVSIQEVQIALQAGVEAHEIIFTPNSISFSELIEAVELGVQINIDNISLLEQFGSKYGDTVPCCIRINPHIVAGGHSHIQTGHIDSKFGISFHQARHVKRIVDTYNIRVNGLHMHTGSDIINPEVFTRGMDILFDLAEDFNDLEFIDFGSGFKVAYKEGDIVTDMDELGKEVCSKFNQYCQKIGKELDLYFEPGKFLVSESGYFLVKVNSIKHTISSVFIGVDSGQNHLIRPMMYEAYHHITNVSNPEGTKRIYSVVGYICETDTFAWDRQLNEVREGDILAIHNAGAYGFMMSSNYNSRLRPAEVLVLNQEAHLIRKRESFEDLMRNQVELNQLT